MTPELAEAIKAADKWHADVAGSLRGLADEAHATGDFTAYDEALADQNDTAAELLANIVVAARKGLM